ncbi:MAG: sugar phosphate nucleotidyltransferase [Fimbriimonadaceae bacterium]
MGKSPFSRDQSDRQAAPSIANRPTLAYAFDQLKDCGIEEICVVVGANEDEMRMALKDGAEFGVKLSYVRQTEPLGLAHAMGFAKDFVGGDDFVLYLGDVIYDQPLKKFVDRFQESGCANLNLVKEVEDPRRFGVANVDGERIIKLVEKPQNPESNLAMAGMYVFGPAIWGVLDDLQPSARGEYEITDAIQLLVDRGEVVLAGVYVGNWFDTGTLDSFLETSRSLAGEKHLIADSAKVNGARHGVVVVGDGATVECDSIEDSVVLPGAKIRVAGSIKGCLLGGEITSLDSLADQIKYNELE